jgi:hypothetical protein
LNVELSASSIDPRGAMNIAIVRARVMWTEEEGVCQ